VETDNFADAFVVDAGADEVVLGVPISMPWNSWIGSYDGTNTDARTGQPNIGSGSWGTNHTSGGWNAVPTTSTTGITHTVVHNTNWDQDSVVYLLQLNNGSGDVRQYQYDHRDDDGTNATGVTFSSSSTSSVDIDFLRYRTGTSNWGSPWIYRIIIWRMY